MKRIFLQAVLLFAGVLATASIHAQNADEVINKYLNAIGGKDNLKKINSLKVEGQMEINGPGLKIPFVMQAVNGKGYRSDAEFQGNKIVEITTPDKGWAQNPMAGQTELQPMSADDLKDKLDQLDLQDPFNGYKEKGSTIEDLGKDEVDGNEYYKIKLTTKHQNETTYFFDLKTNLIYKSEMTVKQQGQDLKQTIKNLDYRDTDIGVKIPYKVDMGGMTMVINKVTTNATVDEKIFAGK